MSKEGQWTEENRSVLLDPSISLSGRYVHLDVTRFCCVFCCVIHSFYPRFTEWNILYCQTWVVQLLWVLCGLCFSLAERPIVQYIARLLVYLLCGVIMNWAAWMVNGWHWVDNIWLMVSHMSFIFYLIVICIILAPVKIHLRRLKQALPSDNMGIETRVGLTRAVLTTGVGIFLCVLVSSSLVKQVLKMLFLDMERSGLIVGSSELPGQERARALAAEISGYVQISASGIWILLMAPRLFSNRAIVAWMLLANFFVQRLFTGYGSAGIPWQGLNLVMVAMAAVEFGMARCRQVALYIHRYWMVVCFGLAFLWTPGLHGPLLLHAPEDHLLRARFIFLEAAIVTAWLTAGHHMVDPKIFSEDKLGWLNEWALLTFLTHQAVLWMLPWPLNLAILIVLGPLCLLGHRWFS